MSAASAGRSAEGAVVEPRTMRPARSGRAASVS